MLSLRLRSNLRAVHWNADDEDLVRRPSASLPVHRSLAWPFYPAVRYHQVKIKGTKNARTGARLQPRHNGSST